MHLHHTSSASTILPPTPPIRALLLDDSQFDRDRIRRLSRKTDLALQLDEVSCLADMERAVQSEDYDLILIDYRLPEGNGLSALSAIQQTARNRDAGTIMITGDAGVDTAVQAMKNGCHDFLTKDAITADRLRAAMMTAMERAHQGQRSIVDRMQQAQIRATVADALSDASMQDTLVGILQGHLNKAGAGIVAPPRIPGAEELSVMVELLMQDDEFVFH